jgi:molecular chaperone Hsp33
MDYMVRMIARDAPVKAMAITGRSMVQRAREIHHTSPVATAALGRSLLIASMLGSQLKEDDGSVTLRIQGDGVLGGILVVADSDGAARGYVYNGQAEVPEQYPGKLDVGGAVGRKGTLTVIKDLKLKEPYVGTVPLVSGEIAEDITAYFAESEQIPSACALGVLVERDTSVAAAGGYLIQLLPGADRELALRVEEGIRSFGAVTPALCRNLSPEELVRGAVPGLDWEVLEKTPAAYRCLCSRERMQTALVSMGREELQEILDTEGRAEITCQFCDKVQVFRREELETLLRAAGRKP